MDLREVGCEVVGGFTWLWTRSSDNCPWLWYGQLCSAQCSVRYTELQHHL